MFLYLVLNFPSVSTGIQVNVSAYILLHFGKPEKTMHFKSSFSVNKEGSTDVNLTNFTFKAIPLFAPPFEVVRDAKPAKTPNDSPDAEGRRVSKVCCQFVSCNCCEASFFPFINSFLTFFFNNDYFSAKLKNFSLLMKCLLSNLILFPYILLASSQVGPTKKVHPGNRSPGFGSSDGGFEAQKEKLLAACLAYQSHWLH